MTSKVKYTGDLRTESTHLLSGQQVISDAPIDNNGFGKAFSPTDMVANSLATCALTIMGIKAKELDIDISNSTAEVNKEMSANPRMISKISVNFEMTGTQSEKERTILERVAMSCPVFLSLNPEIQKQITFNWK